MRLNTLALALVTAVALTGAGCSGCSILTPLTSGQPVITGSVIIKADQSLTTAYLAATGLNYAAKAAVTSGLLVKGSAVAVQVADGLVLLDHALTDADAAVKAGQSAATINQKVAAIYSMIATLKSQIPGAK